MSYELSWNKDDTILPFLFLGAIPKGGVYSGYPLLQLQGSLSDVSDGKPITP